MVAARLRWDGGDSHHQHGQAHGWVSLVTGSSDCVRLFTLVDKWEVGGLIQGSGLLTGAIAWSKQSLGACPVLLCSVLVTCSGDATCPAEPEALGFMQATQLAHTQQFHSRRTRS